MSQTLITTEMLNEAAVALSSHTIRRNRCSCGVETTARTRHQAEVMAEAIAPTLVAEMMHLLGQVAGTTVRELGGAR